jgi:LPXTG-site transpeptidase (sortase) family protein
MKTQNNFLYWGLIFVVILGLVSVLPKNAKAAGTISLTTMGSTYFQNFNSLVSSGTSTTLPIGWDFREVGTGANTTYAAGTGSSSVGNTYSFGATGSTERALGGLQSTVLIPVYGASFTNNTGSVITSLAIVYTGEEWRLGTAGRIDQLTFEYSTTATGLTTGAWIGVPVLDFTTPDTITTGAKNGNAATERTALSATISGLNIATGSTFWIRWTDLDASGADDGLAIDDFSLTPQRMINLSINDASSGEGDSGTNTLTFSIGLSIPAPAGGVTFDITSADNTATTADADYTASHLTGQVIPAGNSTYAFNVLVNGDLVAETDETFFVNVTNVNGATVVDGQGLGTIYNDDTLTTIATSGSPSGSGAPVILTATVIEPGAGNPTGLVEFFNGGASLGTDDLNAGGQAAFSTTLLAVGSHTITATYGGDASFHGSTSPGLTQIVEDPPGVERITDALGAEIVEHGHTNAVITQLRVVFSKAMNAAHAQTVSNYSLMQGSSTAIVIDSAAYDPAAHSTTLNINGGMALANGKYTLTIDGAIADTLGGQIQTDFVRTFFVDNIAPHHISVVTLPDSRPLTNGVTVNIRFSSMQITFDEDVNDPAGNTDRDDVTNPSNYVLVSPGLDGVFDKTSCAPRLAGGDVQIFAGPVTYDNHGGNGPFVATVQFNGGSALSNGTYRLFLCGSTSIVDLAGNALNNGADDQRTFIVLLGTRSNPQTGFAPGVVTVLPGQPAEKAYTDLGNLWIEIPSLNLKTSITGVPLKADGWDVTWLNWQVGWLEGTAYPTWEGNTVLTAHGYTADGKAGPFASLKGLSYGDTISIHLGGMKYTYGIRTNLLIDPDDTHWLTQHETLDWVTLITCQQYDAKTRSYRYRRVVRAVLIRVEKE